MKETKVLIGARYYCLGTRKRTLIMLLFQILISFFAALILWWPYLNTHLGYVPRDVSQMYWQSVLYLSYSEAHSTDVRVACFCDPIFSRERIKVHNINIRVRSTSIQISNHACAYCSVTFLWNVGFNNSFFASVQFCLTFFAHYSYVGHCQRFNTLYIYIYPLPLYISTCNFTIPTLSSAPSINLHKKFSTTSANNSDHNEQRRQQQ